MDIVETLGRAGIIPVIVIEKEAEAVPLARALVKGGLPVLEVTFRTQAAGAIAAIRQAVPEAIVGAVRGSCRRTLSRQATGRRSRSLRPTPPRSSARSVVE